LADGAHTVTVYGADTAGNAATAKVVNFTVDTTAPTVSITAPTEGSTSDTSTVALTATATGAAQMWYSVDGGANSTPVAGATLSANMAGLSNGDHNVTVYANDAVGNVGSATVNFKVDTTAPTVTITSPTEGAKTTKSVSLRATISKPANVWYSVDGGANSTPESVTTTFRKTVAISSAGSHNITVYARDSVNQTGQAVVNFTVSVSGGGLPPAEPTPTPTVTPAVEAATESKVLESVSPAAPAVVEFTEIDVVQVELNVNIDAENVEVNVEQTPEPPADVPDISLSIAADTGVYGYISITTNLPEGAVDNAAVGFKVPKSWFTDNGFDASTTGLQHYNEATGEWESLPTVQTGEDDEYYYFSAETPGFSTFSVTAEKEEAPTPTPPATPTPTETGIPGFEAVLAIGAMLTIAYLVGRRTR
ncbi:MAG: PGF-pre-PGF domain-containing protein, partial [Methermicoccaceae archaeon]